METSDYEIEYLPNYSMSLVSSINFQFQLRFTRLFHDSLNPLSSARIHQNTWPTDGLSSALFDCLFFFLLRLIDWEIRVVYDEETPSGSERSGTNGSSIKYQIIDFAARLWMRDLPTSPPFRLQIAMAIHSLSSYMSQATCLPIHWR